MLFAVFSSDGSKFLKYEDIEPECGVHFCDVCGDCLHCYGGDTCYEEDAHRPLIYASDEESDTHDISACPGCNGPADNGFDRCVPPSAYNCSKCEGEQDEKK